MRILRSKTKVSTAALVLTLTIAATVITYLPVVNASTFPEPNTPTTAYLAFRPNPIGIGQELLVNAWVTPPPPLYTILGLPFPPDWGPMAGIPRENYTFYITDPDGNVDTIGPLTSYGDGSLWFTYIPDQVGTWTIQFSWPGVEFTGAPGAPVEYCSYLPCSTEKQELVVQTEPIPSWPPAELPTEPWNWPINPENREWADIAGAWFEPRYNSSQANFQPYSQAPESSHILWKIPLDSLAGLVGQPYGYIASYGLAGYPMLSTVMFGRGYYVKGAGMFAPPGAPPPTITCVDIRTGEELWTVLGKFSAGAVEVQVGLMGATYSPVLFDVGERIVKYDALTGAVLLDEPGVPGAMFGFFGMGFIDYPYAYVKQHIGLDPTTGYYMVKLRIDGTATDINQRVVWNVTMDSFNNIEPTGDYVLRLYGDIVYNIEYPVFSDTGAFNATTGEILWHHPQESPYAIEAGCSVASLGYGNAYFACQDRHFVAYNLKTGDVVWLSEETEYPWGNFWAYTSAVAYGMVYGFGYAGVYAFNASTGKIEWHYSTGDSGMETPYGMWPIHGMYHAVADGKVYAGTCEHSPTFFYRGNRLHCIDAYNGDPIWSIMGYYTPSAAAEGTLFATNAYDSCIYAFAKGRTLTDVSVSKPAIAAGESVWISGRVTDQSPAQPGTPCVSKESMSAWMEYLHMQQPMPMDTTGVPVHLYACHTNGTGYEIGTATSDGQGYFQYKWTPPNEDFYYITANFVGDESYYSSWNITSLTVGLAPQAPTEPETEGARDYTPLFMGIIAAVVVIGIANIVVTLRKQRK